MLQSKWEAQAYKPLMLCEESRNERKPQELKQPKIHEARVGQQDSPECLASQARRTGAAREEVSPSRWGWLEDSRPALAFLG